MVPDLIFDVGMNVATDTAYYLHKGYRVVAIEADPSLAAKGAQKFKREVESGRLTILNVGVAEDSAVRPFWVNEQRPEYNSFDYASASREHAAACRQIEVKCLPFRAILEEHGVPFYLKIDIEGKDLLCLEALDSSDLPQYASIEIGGLQALSRFRDLGYTGFKWISQFHFLPIQLDSSPEQRRYERMLHLLDTDNPAVRVFRKLGGRRWIQKQIESVKDYGDWTFKLGSSGPFGEDTPGRWLSYDEVCQTHAHYKKLASQGAKSIFWHGAQHSFWTDFHVKR